MKRGRGAAVPLQCGLVAGVGELPGHGVDVHGGADGCIAEWDGVVQRIPAFHMPISC